MADDLKRWIRSLPKAEQHAHDIGAMPIEMLERLAKKYDVEVPRNGYDFEGKGLAGFGPIFIAACTVVRTPDDYRELGRRISLDQAAQNALYSRIHHTPAIPGARDNAWTIGLEGLLGGFKDGMAEGGALCHLIIDIPAQFDAEFPGNDFRERTLEAALAFKVVRNEVPGVIAVGVAGDESQTDWQSYRSMLRDARESGLEVVVHAGESQGATSVRAAFDLLDQPPDRIQHGIAAAQDPELLARIADAGVRLDVAITSNHVLNNLGPLGFTEHPLMTLIGAGVEVTLNTDDSAMFSTDLCREYELAHQLGVDRRGLVQLARNSWNDKFAPAAIRQAALAELDRIAATLS